MRRLGNRFEVGEALGAGGMGNIFRGIDSKSGDTVAIKIGKRTDDPVLRERFRREALSLSRLDHASIVRVLEVGDEDGDLYTVLALVPGETLQAVLARGPLAVDRALDIGDALLSALETCHANDIVHRDVKPSNVMIGERVVLIDFGLARLGGQGIEKLTETGVVQGTPQYMAPEQCRGEDVGPETDIYAVGAVLYEMLVGRPPFEGTDAATFMAQHLFVDPPSLRERVGIPIGVAAAIHAALAKQPEKRPTAAGFRLLLTEAERGNDPETRAEQSADRRRATGASPRLERAIGGSAGTPGTARGHVLVWVDGRNPTIAACLGTGGHRCTSAAAGEEPTLDVDCVVVADFERLAAIRVRAPKLPVIMIDVKGAEETAAAIRAGASDILLGVAPDADLLPKVARLLRRRR